MGEGSVILGTPVGGDRVACARVVVARAGAERELPGVGVRLTGGRRRSSRDDDRMTREKPHMDGQLVLNVVVVIAVLVWIGELVWLFRMAQQQNEDPFHVVSGAAVFFVAAAPLALMSPSIVDRVGGFWETVFSRRPHEEERPSVPARLLISGEQKPLLAPRVRIGRYPNNEIVLEHSTVSAYHAEIIQRPDGRHEIIDRESRNGTRVNGALVRSQILKDGDLITLGAASLHYLSESFADTEAAPLGGYSPQPSRRSDDLDAS